LKRGKKNVPVTGERRALVVVGMHRSGTSATAGVLNLLGASLPKAVMPAVLGANDVGFFEPSRIVEIHDELLAAAGSFWHDTSPVPDAWFRSPPARAFGRTLKATYLEEYGDAPLTVLKDPRLCRLLPLWRAILASLNVTPLFVIPFRHPVEVAASLARLHGFSPRKSHVLWLQHVLLAEHESRGCSRAFLSYEGMMADPRNALARLGQDLAIEWPSPITQALPQLEEFLAQGHHHNRVLSSEGPGPEDLEGLVAATHSVLDGLAGAPSAAQEEALDQIRASYLGADQLQGPLVRSLQIDFDRTCQELAVRTAELTQAIGARDDTIRRLEIEARAQQALALESARQLHHLSQALADARATLAERDRAVVVAEDQIK
jgi:hypothetical protein